MAEGKPYKDFTGYKIKTWTMVSEVGFRGGHTMKWLARCTCGREQIQTSNAILQWKGHCICTGGRPNNVHPLYGTWANMKHRCQNKRNSNYPAYGGRGIKVCDRWCGKDGFANFLSDVGPRPEGATLDRVNVNGNYEPGNVRWASKKEQSANRRLSAGRVEAVLDQIRSVISTWPVEQRVGGMTVASVIKDLLLGDA